MRKKIAFKNVSFSLIQQLVAIICGFIVPRLIIKTYGSEINGLISSITQFLAYITLLEAGIGPVIKSQLYKPIAKKDKDELQNILYASEKYFRIIARVFIVYIALLLIIYPIFVDKAFSRLFSSSLILIIAISSFAEYYFGMTYRLFLQSDQKSYVISFIQTITTILNTTIIIVLALNNVNILLVKIISSLIFTLRPITQYIYVKKKYSFSFNKVDKKFKLKNQWDGLAQHIAAIIYTNTDVVLLTIFTTVTQVSIYSVYHLVTNSLQKINQSISDGIEASFGDILARGEKKLFKDTFNKYEVIYYTVISIMYSCAISLIIPFVKTYTLEVKDANYVIPAFGLLMILSSLAYAIKIPYHSLVKTVGHFKQTQKGAWIEAISNLAISIILVFKLGLIGVAIGTLISTIIRTIELMCYSSKVLIEESILKRLTKIFLTLLEIACLSFLFINYLDRIAMNSLVMFILYALAILALSSLVIGTVNIIIYKNAIIDFGKKMFKRMGRKKDEQEE